MNFILSVKSIVTNVTNLAFVISVFTTKNVINACKKIIIFDAKNR